VFAYAALAGAIVAFGTGELPFAEGDYIKPSEFFEGPIYYL